MLFDLHNVPLEVGVPESGAGRNKGVFVYLDNLRGPSVMRSVCRDCSDSRRQGILQASRVQKVAVNSVRKVAWP